MPNPLQDVYHHLNVYICETPGFKGSLPFEQVVWNCNEPNLQPDLPGRHLLRKARISGLYQLRHGTQETKDAGRIRILSGVVDSGFNYVVLETHYPKASLAKNGRTGHSEMVIRLVPEDAAKTKTKKVGLFNLSAWL